jgi:excinuclease UvrABC ATPase subunit
MVRCPNCDGLGYLEKFDPALIIGNSELSMSEGVILTME